MGETRPVREQSPRSPTSAAIRPFYVVTRRWGHMLHRIIAQIQDPTVVPDCLL
jgi:hypothetical protein